MGDLIPVRLLFLVPMMNPSMAATSASFIFLFALTSVGCKREQRYETLRLISDALRANLLYHLVLV